MLRQLWLVDTLAFTLIVNYKFDRGLEHQAALFVVFSISQLHALFFYSYLNFFFFFLAKDLNRDVKQLLPDVFWYIVCVCVYVEATVTDEY